MKVTNKINVLVIGGGMYVCGRGTDSYGTILPSLLESVKKKIISEISFVTTKISSANILKKKYNKLSLLMDVKCKCEFYPNKLNKQNYLNIAKKIKPDVAIICTPDHLHAKICISLVKLNIHCLVVKPMTTNIKDAKKMLKISEKKKVICQVEFHKRLDKANLELKKQIINKNLGDLLYSNIEYNQKKIIPEKIFKKWSNKTNIFQYLGVHYVDLIFFLTKYKPINVIAWGHKKYLSKKKINTYDSIQVIIEWKKNDNSIFISNHITSWIDPNLSSSMSDQKISLVGTKGKFYSDQKNRGIQIVTDNKGIEDINPYFNNYYYNNNNNIFFDGYGIENIMKFIQDVFLYKNAKRSLKQIDKTSANFKESLISCAIIEAVNKSLQNKSTKIKIIL